MDRYDVSKYNLLELLYDELKEKGKDLTTKEKCDYVYIRMCQLFNFNEIWAYTSNNELSNMIFDKKFDITNIDSRKIVCNGFSHAFCDVLSYLPDLYEDFDDIELLGNLGHVYSMVNFKNEGPFYYDPIGQTNDFLNVKKKFPIEGIIYCGSAMDDGEIYQERSYRKIGYRPDGLDELRKVSSKLQGSFSSADDYFKELIGLSDFTGLGMYEVNNLLNKQTKDALGMNLPEFDIRLDKLEESKGHISFLYEVGDDAVYREDEDDNGVKIYRIR